MTRTAGASPGIETHLHLEAKRLTFRSILAATDLSEESARPVKLGARIAKQYKSNLCVLHAVAPQSYPLGMGGITPMLKQFDLDGARTQLHDYAQRIPDLRVVKHEELIVYASPQWAIGATLAAKRADLLVVGSHGRRGVLKLALGSVAEWAIRHLRCPVLVTGPKCNGTWPSRQSIVLATDLSPDSLRPAQYAASFAQEYNADITVMNVLPPADPRSESDTARRAAFSKLRDLLPADARDWCTPHFAVATGETPDAVLETANAAHATMIVLGARRKPFADHAPWAILSKIIAGARCPVLVVPFEGG